MLRTKRSNGLFPWLALFMSDDYLILFAVANTAGERRKGLAIDFIRAAEWSFAFRMQLSSSNVFF